jgi:2-keto-4-pentenoate hydratase
VVKAIVDAKIGAKPFANPSAQLPGLTMEKAYDLQKKVAAAMVKKGHAISGYKAGLTSKPAQKKFGVNSALLGPLFKTGEQPAGTPVDRKALVKPFIET